MAKFQSGQRIIDSKAINHHYAQDASIQANTLRNPHPSQYVHHLNEEEIRDAINIYLEDEQAMNGEELSPEDHRDTLSAATNPNYGGPKKDTKSLESHLKQLQKLCHLQQKQIKQLIGLSNILFKMAAPNRTTPVVGTKVRAVNTNSGTVNEGEVDYVGESASAKPNPNKVGGYYVESPTETGSDYSYHNPNEVTPLEDIEGTPEHTARQERDEKLAKQKKRSGLS